MVASYPGEVIASSLEMSRFSIVLADNNFKEYDVTEVSLLIVAKDTYIHFKDGNTFAAFDSGFRYDSKDVSHLHYHSFLDAILYFVTISNISTPEMRVYEMPSFSEEEWKNRFAQYEKDTNTEGCIGCGESYPCGAQGYCVPCWKDRYGDGNEDDDYY